MTPATGLQGVPAPEGTPTGVPPGQVRGGGGGDKLLQRRVLKGNATGMHMLSNSSRYGCTTLLMLPSVLNFSYWQCVLDIFMYLYFIAFIRIQRYSQHW